MAVEPGSLLDVVLTKPRLIQVDELALWLGLAQASDRSEIGSSGYNDLASFSEDAAFVRFAKTKAVLQENLA